MRTDLLVQHDVISIELAALIMAGVAIAGVVAGGLLHASWVERHERRAARRARTVYLEAKAEKLFLLNEQRALELWEESETSLTDVAPVTIAPSGHVRLGSLGDRLREEPGESERDEHVERAERDAGAGVKTERPGAPEPGADDATGDRGWTPEPAEPARERD